MRAHTSSVVTAGQVRTLPSVLSLYLFLSLAFVGLSSALLPRVSVATPVAAPHVEVELVSEVESVQPGQTFWAGVRFNLEDGWHVYWKNPGDSGLAPTLAWTLPEGTKAGSIEWPVPHRIAIGPLANFGYEGETLLPVQITPSSDLRAGESFPLAVRAEWLVCKEDCVPGQADLKLSLAIKEAAPLPDPRWESLFATARALMPRSGIDVTASAQQRGDHIVLTVSGTGARAGAGAAPAAGSSSQSSSAHAPFFFPAEPEQIENAAPQRVIATPRGFTLELVKARQRREPLGHLRGTLAIPLAHDPRQRQAIDLDVAMGPAAPSLDARNESAAPVASEGASLWLAVALAALGGLLLNLMPCVFPVLSIKILDFVRQTVVSRTRSSSHDSTALDAPGCVGPPRNMQNIPASARLARSADRSSTHAPNFGYATLGSRETLRRHGLAYAGGVLLSFWVLAGALLTLRAGGEALGWGFQLQSPTFVVAMVFLLTAFALSLLGVYDVGFGLMTLAGRVRQGDGLSGSFVTGVLATVLATPCTAPFMGPALGMALTLSGVGAMLVFTALGAGMALPYVVLCFAPAWLAWLPRPGPWLETFKQLMAFPLLATVVWLVWVLGQQAGVDAVLGALAGLLLLALALWMLGRFATLERAPHVRRRVQMAALAVSLLGIGAALAARGGLPVAPHSSGAQSDLYGIAWSPYSSAAVAELRAAGRPVFIDFTAAWCLTCKVNEHVVFSSAEVRDAFAARDVAMLRADWTSRDDEITQALASFGRNGVPLYVLYGTTTDAAPQVLPSVLTRGIVLDALSTIAESDRSPRMS